MSYKATTSGVQRLSDGAFVPNDPRNQDWREYVAWAAKGNVAQPADPPPVIVPPRDLATELDALKAKVTAAEAEIAKLKVPKP